MVALPPAAQTNLQDNALSAYNVCLDFEEHAKDNDIIRARLLGYLILYAPSLTAQHEVIKSIHSCRHNYSELSKLGKYYIDYFVRPFKKANERTPASSDHSSPSRPSFDIDKKNIMQKMNEAPKNHRDAKEQALIRDGFRCVVTGKYDAKASKSSGLVPQEERLRVGVLYTECAHIVPESAFFGISNTDTSDSSTKNEHAASILAVMKRFGYDIESLKGPKVHSLYNVMTMEKDMHDFFDRLDMWFEATNIENCYEVKTTDPAIFVPQTVTFTSTHPDVLPVPSSKLLGLHAACAKVAHLSGAGEYVDEIDEDMDALNTLAYDGSSFEVLNHAILRSSVRG